MPSLVAAGARPVSPGILLAGLLVLLVAQATRLLVPGRGHLLLAIGAAAAGLLAGELLALSGHGGPSLGAIHPVADLIAMALAEAAVLILLPARRTAP